MNNITTSFCPVKASLVKKFAQLVLTRHIQILQEDIVEYAKNQVKYLEEDNKGLLVRLFGKQKPVPTVDEIVKQVLKDHVDKKLITHSTAWWVLYRMEAKWWQKLEQFAGLPDNIADTVMYLSTYDLDLIDFNKNMKSE